MAQVDLINPILPEFIDKLDPQFVQIYTKHQEVTLLIESPAPKIRADQVTIEEYRKNTSKYTFFIAPGPSPDVGSATIYKVKVKEPDGEILVKVYVPTADAITSGGLKTADGKLPAHVNYHGGGWVIGGLHSDQSWCRQVCQRVGCIIVDVDYRLAPEYKFPIQIWDSWAALKWVFAEADKLGIDSSRVSVGGLSAGGHLSAVLALLARDEPGMPPLKLQMLIVPCVDARTTPVEGSCDPKTTPYETYITCENVPCLPLQRMRWFHNLWLGTDPEKRKEATDMWIASPILASSHANLAPASIHCAEFDCLCSEAVAYNEVLNKAGTPSTVKVYKGVCHPFAHWDGELDKAKEYVDDTTNALKKAYTS
ncbi:MAG: hypothetical protein M1834_006927 [Cirrosporium novae-zelandiae]|nr:MAG: hypothetical protein M1834_006927 [Cirrosporium novae-zelandiae]